ARAIEALLAHQEAVRLDGDGRAHRRRGRRHRGGDFFFGPAVADDRSRDGRGRGRRRRDGRGHPRRGGRSAAAAAQRHGQEQQRERDASRCVAHGHPPRVRPPSTVMTWPVRYESGSSSRRTTLATSSGRPKRGTVPCSTYASYLPDSIEARAMPAMVAPGATTFTRTSVGPPYSLARMRAAWTRAALGAA